MDTLTLRPLRGERWAWVAQTAVGTQTGESPLAAVPRPAAGARVRLLLPGDWVTHTQVAISAKSPRLIAQALPFALEESIAEDVEQVRIAHGARSAEGVVSARVVNRARLDALLAGLAAQGFVPDAIFSELDAIPRPAEGWVLLLVDQQVLALSADEAMSVDAAWLANLLMAGSQVHLVDVPGVETVLPYLPADAVLSREPAPQGAWVWLHQHLREANGIDFLAGQGRGKAWGDALRPWGFPAALAASVVVAQLGLMVMQTHQSAQHIKTMQAEIERVAREAAPEVKRWVNPLVQLRQMTKGTAAVQVDAGLLSLLAAASPALEAQPAVKLGTVRYQAGAQTARGVTGKAAGGFMEMQLQAQDAAALEAIPSVMRPKTGLQVELSGLRAEGGRAEARLRIKEGGA